MQKDNRLPVTILSGFLGAGKTTLMQHILQAKDHGLKCAVIVNDMAALNIDAEILKRHEVVQKEEKIVQMQNGCICCTLREDLVQEVVRLVDAGNIDYILIESTGISEPMQVAETFTKEFADTVADQHEMDPKSEISESMAKILENGGLSRVARLDTMVTVIDCLNFFACFETTDFLTDKYEDVEKEDDRTIADLMVDQIEFANIILLNKTDMVAPQVVNRIEGVIKKLNPAAKIIRTRYSKIDPTEILNTKLFSFEEALMSAGWLKSLHEMQSENGLTPETVEYGIGSFVYTARRPFHPKRLQELLDGRFYVIQETNAEMEEDDEEEWESEDDGETVESDASVDIDEDEEDEEVDQERIDRERREIINAKQNSIFKGLLRSKGFIWLATRTFFSGEWSQSGCMLTINQGMPWYACLPESEWPEDPMSQAMIKKDFQGEFGDRRQELVLIGQDLDRDVLSRELDACLLNDSEMQQWASIMNNNDNNLSLVQIEEQLSDLFEDPFEIWGSPQEDVEEDDEEDLDR